MSDISKTIETIIDLDSIYGALLEEHVKTKERFKKLDAALMWFEETYGDLVKRNKEVEE